MEFKLPTKDECDAIVANCEAFYRADRVVEGQNVAIYDYRLASLSDFTDNEAFELRGLTFVQEENGTWTRNILLNKFFNINQCSGRNIVQVSYGMKFNPDNIKYEGPIDTEAYRNVTAKMIPQKERVIGKEPSWMYEDVQHKKIVNLSNKEDGSIISFVKFANGKVRAKSKASFESDQAQAAQVIYERDTGMQELIERSMNLGYTVVFELVGPENQIVLEYQNTNLVLLQIRRENGEYVDSKTLESRAKEFNCLLADQFPLSMMNLEDLLARKEIDESDIEGWILTFEDGQMAKIKTNKYMQMHGLIGPDAFRENLLIQTILDGNIDDVVSMLVPGEKKDKIIAMEEAVTHKFNHLVVEFKELRRKYFQDFGEVRKDFAIKHSKDECFSGVMKTLNESFRDVEKAAEDQVKIMILQRTNALGKAKDWIKALEVA